MLRTGRILRTRSGRLSLNHLIDEDEKGLPRDGLRRSKVIGGLR